MDVLRILLAKDLLRIRRNPLPILIQIGVAMLLVMVIGLAFGPQARSGTGIAPIKLSIVDEDQSVFTELLQNTATSKEFSEYFDTQFLEREAALQKINDNELSAVVIIPQGFTESFLDGKPGVLELVKNPAQSVYPAIVEEGLNALLALLNALARNFGEELREWRDLLDSEAETDFVSTTFLVAELISETADRLEAIEDYMAPPLVSFESRQRNDDEAQEEEDESFNLYSWLFAGMAGMFLLMISNSLTSDIYREARFGTLNRYATLREGLLTLVVGKMILVIAVVGISAAIMFVGASLVFGFSWENPLPVTAVVFGYSVCAAGLTACIASIAAKEKRADTINTIVIMGFAILGGTMFPVEDLPGFIRDYISPYLPTAWFIGTIRLLQDTSVSVAWSGVALRLCLVGAVLAFVSAFLFHLRILKGVKSG